MHDTTPDTLIEAVQSLAKLRSMARRVDDGMSAVYASLSRQGFDRASVDRALALVDTDFTEEYGEINKVKALLSAMKAPVQIEQVGHYETPVSDDAHLDAVRDQGWYARLEGRERRFRGHNEMERRSFMAGYDELDQLLEGQSDDE